MDDLGSVREAVAIQNSSNVIAVWGTNHESDEPSREFAQKSAVAGGDQNPDVLVVSRGTNQNHIDEIGGGVSLVRLSCFTLSQQRIRVDVSAFPVTLRIGHDRNRKMKMKIPRARITTVANVSDDFPLFHKFPDCETVSVTL